MSEIGVFTPEQARTLWQDYLSRKQLPPHVTQNKTVRREVYPSSLVCTVVLDTAIAAATNGLTNPATATASMLQLNSSGNLEDSDINIEVVNRFESVSLVQYTMCVVMRMHGEWRLISADCGALGGWP